MKNICPNNYSVNSILFIVLLGGYLHAQHPDTLVQRLISQTNSDTLTHYVRVLSGEDSVSINGSRYLITSRYAGNPGNNLAADFIYQTLSRLGLSVFNQNYSSNGRNVYAMQTGTTYPDQQFIICAHYDDMPSFSLAPGADDNASGCAAVLEAARILSVVPAPYTIIYALWDEEEIGLVGSGYYAQQAAASGVNILGVVNLEMFGWDGNDDSRYEIHTRPVAGSIQLANLINTVETLYQLGLNTTIQNPGTSASDHSSFWNHGYSAVVFSQYFFGGDSNPYYHTPSDRIIFFNTAYFYNLSKLAVATIAHMAFNNMIVDIDEPERSVIAGIVLEQNYPNPFNPITTIEFEIPGNSDVILTVYNSAGEEISTLINQELPAGKYTRQWDAGGYASGLYYYRLSSLPVNRTGSGHGGRLEQSEYIQTRKMILLK